MRPKADATLIPMVRPALEPDDRLMSALEGVLRSPQLTNDGPALQRFEGALAEKLGVPSCAVVSSGTSALTLALTALSEGPRRPGEEPAVVLPAFTYPATLWPFIHAGWQPIFCDLDPATWTLDTAHLERLLAAHPRVRAVVPVNVYGIPPDLPAIVAHAHAAGAFVLYDNAHGLGTERDGRFTTPEVDAETFSLHATKTLPAVEGGVVVGPPNILARVRRLRRYGVGDEPLDTSPGFNAKMDEVRATIGQHVLAHFDETLARRRRYWHRLRSALGAFPEEVYRVQRVPVGVVPNGQNLGVRCGVRSDERLRELIAAFRRHGVEARRYFHPPLHQLRWWTGPAEVPTTDALCAGLLCLPLHSRMDETTLERIERAVDEVGRELAAG